MVLEEPRKDRDGMFRGEVGYGLWCQRGQCHRCRVSTKCECPHHSGGVADQEIVKVSVENSINRGALAAKCQEQRHQYCRSKWCRCKCHVGPATTTTVVVKEEAPIASEEHVLELQERIYAAEASFIQKGDEVAEIATRAVVQVGDATDQMRQGLTEFDIRLTTMEAAKRIEVKVRGKKEPIDVGLQHNAFPTLLTYTNLGLNVFMRGPAGSGKTSAAYGLAKALGVPLYVMPLGPQTSKSDLLGYMNGAGDYVPSLLRKAYEHGGILLLDEIDAANPGVLTIINGLLANGHSGFADKMVDKHKDCYFVAAGNTYGRGADTMYVGRAQLDAATLDRWIIINWDYDWAFAAQLSGNQEWTSYIQKLHERVSELKIRVVIGMRAALHGATMLASGIDRKEVEDACIWRPISADDKNKILAGMKADEPEEEVPDFSDNTDYIHENPIDPSISRCPKCQSLNISVGIGANVKRRQLNKAPIPDYKCLACLKWRMWPRDYDWKTSKWMVRF